MFWLLLFIMGVYEELKPSLLKLFCWEIALIIKNFDFFNSFIFYMLILLWLWSKDIVELFIFSFLLSSITELNLWFLLSFFLIKLLLWYDEFLLFFDFISYIEFIVWLNVCRLFYASEAGPPKIFDRFPKLNLKGLVCPFENSSSIPIISVFLFF